MPELMDTFANLHLKYSAIFKTSRHIAEKRDDLLKVLPKEIGVYIIARKSDSACPIYIGSAGKIASGPIGLIYSGSTIRQRILWASTPYHINGTTNEFEYDPTTTGVPPAGYGSTIPLREIEINCLIVNVAKWQAPSALEHLLIQGFINQFKQLPQVNQKI